MKLVRWQPSSSWAQLHDEFDRMVERAFGGSFFAPTAQDGSGAALLSVPVNVIDRGDSLRLTFEERDQLRLRHFANGNGRPSQPMLAVAQQSLLPGSSALVVSGSAPVANIVGQLIQGWGASVQTVGSVEDALDFLRQRAVDVIVHESLPRSTDERIDVELERARPEPAGGERWEKLREERGVLTWVRRVPRGGEETIELETSIAYPEGETLHRR